MVNKSITPKLSYNPQNLPRELNSAYIHADETDIKEMLKSLGLSKLEDLFQHIPGDIRFDEPLNVPEEMSYNDLVNHVHSLSIKNNIPKHSFLGNGLAHYKSGEIAAFVCGLRGLTTAYTPYQPERSQGSLMTQWLYQSLLSMITGYEAVNASMYDRSTTLFETLKVAISLGKNKKHTCLVFDSIFPGDLEVIKTLSVNTNLKIKTIPIDPTTGIINLNQLKETSVSLQDDLAAIVFPQINSLGNLEQVDQIVDLADNFGTSSIAVIDPMTLGCGGLKPPSSFGQNGATMFVAEGQHIALPPNFGGPGIGILGIRFNEKNPLHIRSMPGRFVGEGKDIQGQSCKLLVLSTREQHIRREKASSNICTNAGFIATLVGASLLELGEDGLAEASQSGMNKAHKAAQLLGAIKGIELPFANTPFWNEFVVSLPCSTQELIQKAQKHDIHIGVDVSGRIADSKGNHLLLSFSNLQTDHDIETLISFIRDSLDSTESNDQTASLTKTPVQSTILAKIPEQYLRKNKIGLPSNSLDQIKDYYSQLEQQNISPDYSIYPLGSCTMKYNPYLNEYAANLLGFTQLHPDAPTDDCQGSLEILYNIQEYFKAITGLSAVTAQPVAGAQGELVGIKLFQAYHLSKNNTNRDIILIPKSAHGTNPATATMAGFITKKDKELGATGIVLIDADSSGKINFDQIKQIIEQYNNRIAGIMITNPNTSGLFETEFKMIAEMIHQVGGLVYLDGANMNAIAGWVNLAKMGVDAVHNNLHKTWSIPHGGGGPGAAIVAVSSELEEFLPGLIVDKQSDNDKQNDKYYLRSSQKSIGSVHRHLGNFAHNIRCYTYLRRLGAKGIKNMSAIAVLSSRYLYQRLKSKFDTLPRGAENAPRMHEFILTLPKETLSKVESMGIPKALIASRIGKLFLDFGFHAPTVSFPEPEGLMIEPTESYSKAELDRFADAIIAILELIDETPAILNTVPHFTPITRVDETAANRKPIVSSIIKELPPILKNKIHPKELSTLEIAEIKKRILDAHLKITN